MVALRTVCFSPLQQQSRRAMKQNGSSRTGPRNSDFAPWSAEMTKLVRQVVLHTYLRSEQRKQSIQSDIPFPFGTHSRAFEKKQVMMRWNERPRRALVLLKPDQDLLPLAAQTIDYLQRDMGLKVLVETAAEEAVGQVRGSHFGAVTGTPLLFSFPQRSFLSLWRGCGRGGCCLCCFDLFSRAGP